MSKNCDKYLSRCSKQTLLSQRACSIWLTGYSGAGKTTIACLLENKLHHEGFLIKVFDGDNIRKSLNSDLDYTELGRTENIRRVASINKEFLNCGVIVINSFISPTIAIRQMAKNIISKDDFLEIYIDCPLYICEQRDPKGLYKKARLGEIKNFTGIDSVYEVPENPDLVVPTNEYDIPTSVEMIYRFIINKIRLL